MSVRIVRSGVMTRSRGTSWASGSGRSDGLPPTADSGPSRTESS
ncbi:hypothetical protein BN903_34 [Halorubrum sp. AJ67]|nr:hypothetical protein BN903_34 [Halorubrum sp. AJ67]